MAINSYKCDNKECDFTDEYIESISVCKESWHPEMCPKCGKGKLEKVEDWNGGRGGFDIVGYCYNNVYGKKNWKKGKSQEEIIKVLNENKSPY